MKVESKKIIRTVITALVRIAIEFLTAVVSQLVAQAIIGLLAR